MKLEAKAADLAAAATAAARIIDEKCKIPIVSNLLLAAAADHVEVTGHDLDRSLTVACPVTVNEPGSITVPGERFAKLLASLDHEAALKIETVDTALAIKAGRARYRLETLPAYDFPAPLTADGITFELDADAAHRLFVLPSPAISTEQTRYYLNGICLQAIGDRLVATATDGRKLITVSIAAPPDIGASHSPIIPHAAVTEIGRLEKYAPVKIRIAEKQVEASAGPHRFGSKLIDGTFPDYARVIPKTSNNTFDVDREDLLAAIARIDAVAERVKKATGTVGFQWDGGELRLCLSSQPNAADDVLAGIGSGTGRVAASTRYLTELLNVLDGERVKIDSADGASPVLLTAPGDDHTLCLVMPCRWPR